VTAITSAEVMMWQYHRLSCRYRPQSCDCFEDRAVQTVMSIEHVAWIDDLEVAETAYRAAVARWPAARIDSA